MVRGTNIVRGATVEKATHLSVETHLWGAHGQRMQSVDGGTGHGQRQWKHSKPGTWNLSYLVSYVIYNYMLLTHMFGCCYMRPESFHLGACLLWWTAPVDWYYSSYNKQMDIYDTDDNCRRQSVAILTAGGNGNHVVLHFSFPITFANTLHTVTSIGLTLPSSPPSSSSSSPPSSSS